VEYRAHERLGQQVPGHGALVPWGRIAYFVVEFDFDLAAGGAVVVDGVDEFGVEDGRRDEFRHGGGRLGVESECLKIWELMMCGCGN
jgi:hypothetical protein